MSWREREYHRSEYGGRGAFGPILSVLFGSVPLGTWFGIRVRAHASLVIFIAFTLLLGPSASKHFTFTHALISMSILFGIVLLHEFGHCFAARAVGGYADDIILSPIGGLASASPPHRPWPTFLTVAGGPAVNVGICLITGVVLFFTTGGLVPLNPFYPLPPENFAYTSAAPYLWWIFSISYILLLFNLLPIFPLDGGQILHTVLWPRIGHYRSMNFSCITGMVGAVMLGLVGIGVGQWLLLFIGIFGFLTCYQRRMMLRELGPEVLEDTLDFSESLRPDEPSKRHRLSRRARRKIQRLAQREREEQTRIDAILEKVSAHGMQSLNWFERRALRKATERQRQRDLELSRSYES